MQASYGKLIQSAAVAATLLASILLIVKIFAWWYTGSVSLLAALVDSLVDIAASLTNLLVVRYSLQPADADHTFGHGKAESLAALAQSMFISGSALFLFLTGIQHLASPNELRSPGIGIIVTLVALVSTLFLVTFQRWVVRKTRSQAIRADMLHYQSDVFMNGAILVALILSSYGFTRADALFALGIGVYILLVHCVWVMRRYSRYSTEPYPTKSGSKSFRFHPTGRACRGYTMYEHVSLARQSSSSFTLSSKINYRSSRHIVSPIR